MVNKIIVAEDNRIVALHIKQILELEGYFVPLIVDTGEDAIKGCRELLPDLIIIDINLKGELDGIKAAVMINKLKIPIICVSGSYDNESLKSIKTLDSCYFLSKPFLETELLSEVKSVIKHH